MRVPEKNANASQDGTTSGAEFPPATRDRWRELVAGVLRRSGLDPDTSPGAPEDLLATTTYDGVVLRPLYTEEDGLDSGYPGLAPFTRGRRPQGAVTDGWDVRQAHADPDPGVTRRAILADLENGVSSLWLVTGEGGVAVDDIGEVLTDVLLGVAPVTLDAGADYVTAADALLAAHADDGVPATAVTGNLGIDPITVAARSGEPADLDTAARFAVEKAADHPSLLLVTVDATPYHEAGGSEAQELGAAMASGVAYLRALTGAGMDLAEAAARLEFRFAATADQFLTIAKLRAARAMWNRVTEVCGLAPAQRTMRQHVVTSAAMMTRRAPYVNVLRTTLACFSAGVAGADAITVRPFDSALGLPDPLARRIARNTQSLLVEEAHLARVTDPAGGSFYVERLTADLYARGWAFFQELEGAGGMVRALADGVLAERIEEVWRQRRANLAHRRDPLTGVSEFPDLAEPVLERRPAPARPTGPGALPQRRYAEDYETLRARSDAHLARTGERPRVFLATLGPLAAHTARAGFAANLFAAGGIEPVRAGVVDGADELAARFRDSGTTVACLCSSDAVYAEQAAAAARALREAGATRVLLAGRPEGTADVDGHVFTGCDALGLLEELCDHLGVAR
ncbi:heterodimeric methylmalonyl-CoA mutase small subunit [Marinactinospora thermotolerans DSM 45154]|uniref:methylmalonyl-CoA mutase n=1 Tax=Marinactinospora thermotolerans DSM 45154 TaxID=1122192 RepID=A0A1T4N6K8_9ACTN|nr:methylmalonyl-CoA mutase family protein [Marinactinospora thermotolerans]SJZ74745.1 heterodimeric methylmalonyl-CoA mutase small subunit [Marinactinospora thermotolerans DSM 45154]